MVMERMIYALICLAVGIFQIYYGIKFMKDNGYAQRYVEKNPKASLFRKLFGTEKTIRFVRKVSSPLALFMGVVFITIGVVMLFI